MIEIRNLDKYYNRGKSNQIHAVDSTTLSLPEHGMIAFFGKSGCGKTTLLNIIGGLDSAQQGSVAVDGELISPNANDARCQKIGYIFQNYNLSSQMDVYENVASSLRLCGVTDEADIERRVIAALRSVEMDKYRKRYPTELSGGQQQRVAIARAIVKNPDVILADEPTGNLDEHNTVLVMDLLKEISRKQLVLLVTHEKELVDLYCDEVIEIIDGKITQRYENEITEGYDGKRAGDVYLGDMEKHDVGSDMLTVECFGELGAEPLKLRLISHGGVLYLSVPDGVRMKFADSSSELKIHEGKYEEKQKEKRVTLDECLSAPVNYGKSGRIYRFKNSVKSAYKSSFGRKKKGRRALIAALVSLAMITVLMISLYGSVFYNEDQIRRGYNTSTVYVNASSITSGQLETLRDKYDNVHAASMFYSQYYNSYDEYLASVKFGRGHFETIGKELGIEVSSNIFPETAIAGRKCVLGVSSGLTSGQAVISRELADSMLEDTVYENVNDYSDLLGLTGGISLGWSGMNTDVEIVGIVEGDDMAIYMNNVEYAHVILSMSTYSDNAFRTPEEQGIKGMKNGEIYILTEYYDENTKAPAIGETVMLRGMSFKIAGYINAYTGEDIKIGTKSAKGRSDGSMDIVVDVDSSVEIVYESSLYVSGVVLTQEDMVALIPSYGQTSEIISYGSINIDQYGGTYYVVHSKDTKALAEALIEIAGRDSVITPDDIYEIHSSSYDATRTTLTVALIVIIAVMCLCLYLIMRSSIMSEVKQIGIYRAIGVSRKNILFRYFIETSLVFACTVFIGYAVATFGISRIISLMGQTIESVMFYPAWLAGFTLIGLFAACTVCGMIPVFKLLRKTPSEILSKCDI